MSKKIPIGLQSVYAAALTADTSGGATWGTPFALTGVRKAAIRVNAVTAEIFGDDTLMDSAEMAGPIEVELEFVDLSHENEAALLGHVNTSGVMAMKYSDESPYHALMFKAPRSNSGYSLYVLYKGRFSKPDVEHQTKDSSITYSTRTLVFRGVALEYNGAYGAKTREDAVGVAGGTLSGWFSAVYLGAADTTAPTITTPVPVQGATGISKTAAKTAVFSESLMEASVNSQSCYLVDLVTNLKKAATVTYTEASKTVTITPVSALEGSTLHAMVFSGEITDLAGNHFGGAAYTFTTAA